MNFFFFIFKPLTLPPEMTAKNPYAEVVRGRARKMLKRSSSLARDSDSDPDEVLVHETPSPERPSPKIVRSQAFVIPDDISKEAIYMELQAAMDRIRALEAISALSLAKLKQFEDRMTVLPVRVDSVVDSVIAHSQRLDVHDLQLACVAAPRPPPLPFFLPIPASPASALTDTSQP